MCLSVDTWTDHERPHFHSRTGAQSWKTLRDGQSLIEVRALERLEATQYFLGLGKGSIGGEHFSVLFAQGGGSGRWLQRHAADRLSASNKLLVPGAAVGVDLIPFVTGKLRPAVSVGVDEHQVSHGVFLLGFTIWSNENARNRHRRENIFSPKMRDRNGDTLPAFITAGLPCTLWLLASRLQLLHGLRVAPAELTQ